MNNSRHVKCNQVLVLGCMVAIIIERLLTYNGHVWWPLLVEVIGWMIFYSLVISILVHIVHHRRSHKNRMYQGDVARKQLARMSRPNTRDIMWSNGQPFDMFNKDPVAD